MSYACARDRGQKTKGVEDEQIMDHTKCQSFFLKPRPHARVPLPHPYSGPTVPEMFENGKPKSLTSLLKKVMNFILMKIFIIIIPK